VSQVVCGENKRQPTRRPAHATRRPRTLPTRAGKAAHNGRPPGPPPASPASTSASAAHRQETCHRQKPDQGVEGRKRSRRKTTKGKLSAPAERPNGGTADRQAASAPRGPRHGGRLRQGQGRAGKPPRRDGDAQKTHRFPTGKRSVLLAGSPPANRRVVTTATGPHELLQAKSAFPVAEPVR